MDENIITIALDYMAGALGQVVAYCKATYEGFDLESIDYAPMCMFPSVNPVVRHASPLQFCFSCILPASTCAQGLPHCF